MEVDTVSMRDLLHLMAFGLFGIELRTLLLLNQGQSTEKQPYRP